MTGTVELERIPVHRDDREINGFSPGLEIFRATYTTSIMEAQGAASSRAGALRELAAEIEQRETERRATDRAARGEELRRLDSSAGGGQE